MSSPIGNHPGRPEQGEPGVSGGSSIAKEQESIEPGGSGAGQGVATDGPAAGQVTPSPETPPAEALALDAGADADTQSLAPETDFESYETFYGMREPPFTLTPNPAFFFLNDTGREGLK